MISSISVENFQSLYDVSVDLGKFTVIVGPSSSGKSALVRALKALASNPRSSAFVSHGQKYAKITVKRDDSTVTFEKGEGHALYLVASNSDGENKYTKLGGAVPEQVSRVLGIRPMESGQQHLNFAGQLDKPFLLDESGSVVARVLGELTNVTRIFDAVREANRRRQNQASTVKVRTNDVEALEEEKKKFTGIKSQVAALEEAQELARKAQDSSYKLDRLKSLSGDLALAESVINRPKPTGELPSIEPVLAAKDRLLQFRETVSSLRREASSYKSLQTKIKDSQKILSEKKEELQKVLVEAGECPTCGQGIR